MVSYDDGSEWYFGKRGIFPEGHLQHEPEAGSFVRGPDTDPYWRSGSGRWGGRSGVGKIWNSVNWALYSHDKRNRGAVSAQGLFRESFPRNQKADFDAAIVSGEDTQEWIKHFMNLAAWKGKGKGAVFTRYGGWQRKGKGKASSGDYC